MVAQWVQLDDDVLIATGRGAWVQPAHLAGPAFLLPMPNTLPGSRDSTRNLLDGAIAAGERAAKPPTAPTITRSWWAWQLIAQWYSAHHSIALMPLAIERFRAERRADLVQFAESKLEEEQGHDELPLDDLRELGYDAEAAVRSIAPPHPVLAGIEYARRALAGPRPVEFLGYVYAVERRLIRIPRSWFDHLGEVLGPNVDGAAGLRAHALSLDRDHVPEAVAFFATLPARDRATAAVGAYKTGRVRCFASPTPSDEQLAGWLSPYIATHAASIPSPVTLDGGST